MAGELAEYMPILCEKYEIDRRDVNICLVDTLDRDYEPPTELSAKAERRLRKMGVNILLGTSVVGIGLTISKPWPEIMPVVRRGTSR